jgi:hypothetical protein
VSRIRWKLTTEEEGRYVVRSRQLAALGIDIKVPEPALVPGIIDIEVGWGPEFYNVIFEYKNQLVIAAGIHMVGRRSDIYLGEGMTLTLPWAVPEFELLELGDGEERHFRIGGFELDTHELLNSRLQAGLRLQRGKPVTGILLARALKAILPSEYRHGAAVPVEIAFRDSLKRFSSGQGLISINRRIGVQTSLPMRRRSSLFELDESCGLNQSHFSNPLVRRDSGNRQQHE